MKWSEVVKERHVNVPAEKSRKAGPMEVDEKDLNRKKWQMRKELEQAEKDRVWDEEVLSPEEQEEIDEFLKSLEEDE